MKNHLHCPKCASKKVWLIEKYRVPGDSPEGRVLPLVPHQSDAKASLFRDLRAHPKGHLDLYICDGCGYAELWAGGFADLKPDPERGVRLLDMSDAKVGPFR